MLNFKRNLIFLVCCFCLWCSEFSSTFAEIPTSLNNVGWLIGKWRSEFGGKLVWPTAPTMTFGEDLEFAVSPLSYTASGPYLSYNSRAWSHSTKDHFLDSYGFLSQDDSYGNVTFLNIGNNGFTTIEGGKARQGYLNMRLKEIGRIAIARDLPVEDLYRQFRLIDDDNLEQVLLMRTATHPADKNQLLEHSRVLYQRVKGPEALTTTPAPTAAASTSGQSNTPAVAASTNSATQQPVQHVISSADGFNKAAAKAVVS